MHKLWWEAEGPWSFYLTNFHAASSSSLSGTIALPPGPNEMQVLDLSNNIRINNPHHVYCGGFADIYHGEWIQEGLCPDQRVEEKITQARVFPLSNGIVSSDPDLL